jgi:hypothetical protein
MIVARCKGDKTCHFSLCRSFGASLDWCSIPRAALRFALGYGMSLLLGFGWVVAFPFSSLTNELSIQGNMLDATTELS